MGGYSDVSRENEYLKEAAQSVYVANADEMVRQKCRAREDVERHERTMKRNMDLLKQENATLRKEVAYNTVQPINNLMENLQLSLEKACEALGKTVEDYQNAKRILNLK